MVEVFWPDLEEFSPLQNGIVSAVNEALNNKKDEKSPFLSAGHGRFKTSSRGSDFYWLQFSRTFQHCASVNPSSLHYTVMG